jgi:hypothetical protein
MNLCKKWNVCSNGRPAPAPAPAQAPAPVIKQQVEASSAELAARMMSVDIEQVLVAGQDMDASYVI